MVKCKSTEPNNLPKGSKNSVLNGVRKTKVQKRESTTLRKANSHGLDSSKITAKDETKHKVGHTAKPLKPPKFSWVVEGLVAGQGRPTKPGHLTYLRKNGIKYLVTLTKNKPTAIKECEDPHFAWIHIPVQDEKPPSLDQIRQFICAVDKAKEEGTALSVHCAWGRGRTGTLLACYLLREDSRHDADSAITAIRQLRPGSIDTEVQMQAIRGYAQYLTGHE